MKKINKTYAELMYYAEQAKGRKEVLSFLKKAAKLKSKFESKVIA